MKKHDNVMDAFSIIIEEVDAVIADVASQAKGAIDSRDYKEVAQLMTHSVEIEQFMEKLQLLQNEWSKGLSKFQPAPLASVQPSTTKPQQKSVRFVLSVKFSDGDVIQEHIVARTFVQSLEKMGLERVMALGRVVCGIPLVSKKKGGKYHSQEKVAEYWVTTNSSTNSKAEMLKEVARELGVKITVNMIPK